MIAFKIIKIKNIEFFIKLLIGQLKNIQKMKPSNHF